ncbi:vesicular glutamate transporter 1-like [Actinia tenebrosa]|uniref:Sialin n=1 Tax=Actinia tenebrosa TaxID=6105 RepID=A0A6P8H1J3_ACTTE|nr:vesicular glutamate transporter 1-like [Actinia tenebrosa]
MSEKDNIALRAPHDKYTTSPYDHQLFGEGEDSKKKSCYNNPCGKRYLVAFLALLGFANVYALRVNLSVALVAMVTNHTIFRHGHWIEIEPEFSWSPQLQGIILSAFFYGYIITQLPGGVLAIKFGGRNLFGFGVFCTSVLTILIPLAARWNVGILIALRILIGICEGVVYPANHAVWSKWAPPLERSKLTTISASGSYFGTLIAMALSGVLAQVSGWPAIFYVFGSFGIVWTFIWFLIVRNSPSEDHRISQRELEFIQRSLKENGASTKPVTSIPWKSIFTSLPVWAIVVAHFSENWGFYTLLTELPTYLKNRLDFDLGKAGFLAALPYLVMTIVVQGGGQIADCLRIKEVLSTTAVRKLFNSIGFLAQAVCLVIAGYTTDWMVVVVCLTLSVGLGGLAFSGYFVNHLDIAPQYASVLMGISNTVATLPGILSPLLTGAIVQHQTAGEWRIVFYLGGAIYAAGCIFYVIFASGHVQFWATGNGYEEVLVNSDDAEEKEEEEEEINR